jgi:predicted nucleic acid-binding protein
MIGASLRGHPTPILITDAGMFMGEIVRSCRDGGTTTSMLWALHMAGAKLYLPREIVEEVTNRLYRRAGCDTELALERFARFYLPHAIIVDEVPSRWGQHDERVQSLALRDPSDLPSARLSVAIGAFLLAEDPDLVDLGLGTRSWLVIAHAAANSAEYTFVATGAVVPSALTLDLATAAVKGFLNAAPIVQLIIVLGLGYGIYRAGESTRVREAVRRIGPQVAEAADRYGPPIAEVMSRHLEAQALFNTSERTSSPKPTLGELIARILARSGSHDAPLLAEDIARELSGLTLRERTQLVRAELLAHPNTFTQVSRGRFALGRPQGNETSMLPPEELVDFLRRSHKETWTPKSMTTPLVRPAQ